MSGRLEAILLTLSFAAACARHHAAPPPAVVSPPPAARQLAAIEVAKFDVSPPSPHRGQAITVTVTLKNAPRSTPVTLSWFGPDGWLVFDQIAETRGDVVSFVAPSGTFLSPGRYHGDLRSDAVHLGSGDVTVTD